MPLDELTDLGWDGGWYAQNLEGRVSSFRLGRLSVVSLVLALGRALADLPGRELASPSVEGNSTGPAHEVRTAGLKRRGCQATATTSSTALSDRRTSDGPGHAASPDLRRGRTG